MRKLGCLVAILFLSACESGGGNPPVPPPPAVVHITCAEVANDATATHCTKSGWLFLVSPAIARDFENGDVSRGEPISATQEVSNVDPVPFEGFIEASFDAGCGGTGLPWNIMPRQAITVPSGGSIVPAVSGQCSDMPTGDRQLVVTVYGADAKTVIDSAVVRFKLIDGADQGATPKGK